MQSAHRFLVLDAMRGVSSLAVVAFHFPQLWGGRWFPHGSLAVDFFFMLSGFVLTYAYERRLDEGWSSWSFMKLRFIRLYPLYGLALAVGVLVQVPHLADLARHQHPNPTHESIGADLILILLGIFLVPAPQGLGGVLHGNMFPYNGPSWSLFYETAANLAHAIGLRRRSLRTVSAVVTLAGFSLVATAVMRGGLDVGWQRGEVLVGLGRVAFSYFLGTLLLRVWRSGKVRLRVRPLLLAVCLVAVLAAPVPGTWEAAYSIAVVALFCPVVILAGASSAASTRLAGTCRLLGASSYGVYVLHGPCGQAFLLLWSKALGQPAELHAPWTGALSLAFTVCVVLAVDRWYDLPVREWLRSHLSNPKQAERASESR